METCMWSLIVQLACDANYRSIINIYKDLLKVNFKHL